MCLLQFNEATAPRPATLAIGLPVETGRPQIIWLLAIGYWLLAIGYWLLAIGYWLLAIGYWLLAIGIIKSSHLYVKWFLDTNG
jgi:hypothetical protein